tara:strand:- start:1518 stop:2084 length:567 start_codon:yes stop_codon:yes gene_type:complete
MKILLILAVFFIISSCSTNKTYWCGDHPCINKKERQAYFEKNMIVEVRKINKKDKQKLSEIEKITKQARLKEKKRIKSKKELAKQARLDEKKMKREQKELLKQARLDQKRREREEKKIAKMTRENQKIELKKVKKNIKSNKAKNEKKIQVSDESFEANASEGSFNKIVERVTQMSKQRPFPDINKMPE